MDQCRLPGWRPSTLGGHRRWSGCLQRSGLQASQWTRRKLFDKLGVRKRIVEDQFGFSSVNLGQATKGARGDALAPRADERRGLAAISLGEPQAGVDPGISEIRKRLEVNLRERRVNP